MTVPNLPGRCTRCGAVLWLSWQPLTWREPNGAEHRCKEAR